MTGTTAQTPDGERGKGFLRQLGGGSVRDLLLATVSSRVFGVVVGLIATFTFFTAVEPRFLSVSNILEMAVQLSLIHI